MCGDLTPYLRVCGHDTVYAGDRGVEADDRLRELARTENRRLVTRDRDLAARTEQAITLTTKDTAEALAELAAAGVPLEPEDEPTRCGRCNGDLVAVEGGETPDYAPDPGEERVWRCRDCGQYFWKGSHWDRMEETLLAV